MAQFDVFRNSRRAAYPLLVDIQSDFVDELESRVVVPLVPIDRFRNRVSRLHPIVRVEGSEYAVIIEQLAAIPASSMGARAGSLAHRRAEIIAALDLLFTGF